MARPLTTTERVRAETEMRLYVVRHWMTSVGRENWATFWWALCMYGLAILLLVVCVFLFNAREAVPFGGW